RSAYARALSGARGARAAALRTQLESLERSLSGTLNRLREAEQDLHAIDLRASLEESQMGLRFELVDVMPPIAPAWSRRARAGLVFGGALLFLLPGVALALGALDSRVRSVDDVRSLGLVPLGHVPALDGRDIK